MKKEIKERTFPLFNQITYAKLIRLRKPLMQHFISRFKKHAYTNKKQQGIIIIITDLIALIYITITCLNHSHPNNCQHLNHYFIHLTLSFFTYSISVISDTLTFASDVYFRHPHICTSPITFPVCVNTPNLVHMDDKSSQMKGSS